MRVLLVYCHPVPESFGAALRDAVADALRKSGHAVDLIDLYAEGFDPIMPPSERRTYNDVAPSDPVVAAHVARLKRAEALVFVYPTWWYGLPAMLKGWLDRVWSKDVAFSLTPEGRIEPLMRHISKIAVVTTCGAPWWWSTMIGQPGRKTILRGLRALCAPRCRTLFLAHYLMDSSTPETRAAFLGRVSRKLSAF